MVRSNIINYMFLNIQKMRHFKNKEILCSNNKKMPLKLKKAEFNPGQFATTILQLTGATDTDTWFLLSCLRCHL